MKEINKKYLNRLRSSENSKDFAKVDRKIAQFLLDQGYSESARSILNQSVNKPASTPKRGFSFWNGLFATALMLILVSGSVYLAVNQINPGFRRDVRYSQPAISLQADKIDSNGLVFADSRINISVETQPVEKEAKEYIEISPSVPFNVEFKDGADEQSQISLVPEDGALMAGEYRVTVRKGMPFGDGTQLENDVSWVISVGDDGGDSNEVPSTEGAEFIGDEFVGYVGTDGQITGQIQGKDLTKVKVVAYTISRSNLKEFMLSGKMIDVETASEREISADAAGKFEYGIEDSAAAVSLIRIVNATDSAQVLDEKLFVRNSYQILLGEATTGVVIDSAGTEMAKITAANLLKSYKGVSIVLVEFDAGFALKVVEDEVVQSSTVKVFTDKSAYLLNETMAIEIVAADLRGTKVKLLGREVALNQDGKAKLDINLQERVGKQLNGKQYIALPIDIDGQVYAEVMVYSAPLVVNYTLTAREIPNAGAVTMNFDVRTSQYANFANNEDVQVTIEKRAGVQNNGLGIKKLNTVYDGKIKEDLRLSDLQPGQYSMRIRHSGKTFDEGVVFVVQEAGQTVDSAANSGIGFINKSFVSVGDSLSVPEGLYYIHQGEYFNYLGRVSSIKVEDGFGGDIEICNVVFGGSTDCKVVKVINGSRSILMLPQLSSNRAELKLEIGLQESDGAMVNSEIEVEITGLKRGAQIVERLYKPATPFKVTDGARMIMVNQPINGDYLYFDVKVAAKNGMPGQIEKIYRVSAIR